MFRRNRLAVVVLAGVLAAGAAGVGVAQAQGGSPGGPALLGGRGITAVGPGDTDGLHPGHGSAGAPEPLDAPEPAHEPSVVAVVSGHRLSAPLLPSVTGVRWQSGSTTFAGQPRSWLLAVPDHPRAPRLPLLVYLHGRMSSPALDAERTGLLPLVGAGSALIAYPSGWHASWNAGLCCGAAHSANIPDRAFLSSLISELARRPDVDPTRVAVLGFSNGGRMALDLACSRAVGALRAVVAVEAIETVACPAGPGVATLAVAGTADPYVPFGHPGTGPGHIPLPSVQQELAGWRAAEHCSSAAVAVPAPLALHQQLWGCGTHGPLSLLVVPNGEHSWAPGVTPAALRFLAGPLRLS